MQEPRTWREFLEKIIEDAREKQRLAHLLGVSERTLDRWATGLSSPRSASHVRQLLKALPHHRAVLGALMRHDFPDAVEQSSDESEIFIDEVIKEVPIPFYKRILETYATAVEPVRSWTICNLVLQQLAQHLDIDHQGIRVLLMQCQEPGDDGKVHSLRMLFEHTSGQGVSENWPLFYGAESLAGQAVMKGVLQMQHMRHTQEPLAHNLKHVRIRSAVAYPIQRAGRCAGSLLVLSAREAFFTQARLSLLQHYTYLLTLAFQEDEFYAPADIALQPMPAERMQQHMLDSFHAHVLALFCQASARGEALTWLEAEQRATQEIEAALAHLSQEQTTEWMP